MRIRIETICGQRLPQFIVEKVHNIIKVIDRTETIVTGNQIIANVKLLKYITGIRRQHETFIMLNAEGITKFRGNSFYINKT